MAITNPYRSAEAEKLFKEPESLVVNGHVVTYRDVSVHSFTMGDVEDPDLYAAQPIHEWQQSEQGQWVMQHAVETPFWHRSVDPASYGHRYHIIARLKEQDQTYWALKWQSYPQLNKC